MTDAGDLIKADAIPGKEISIELITLYARNLRKVASRVRDHGAATVTNWSALSGSYQAPDAQQLFGVMTPVGTNTTTFGDHLDTVTGALESFAEEVAPIKAELDRLRAEALAFYYEVKDGVTVDVVYATRGGVIDSGQTQEKAWHEDDATVDKNNQLRIDVNTQMELLWAAERRAANTIRALYCAAPLVADNGSGGANTYMYDEIPDDAEVPWGHPVERTEDCGEAAVTFVFEDFLWKGVVVGGLWGTVQGLGGLVSYNSQTGEWGDWNFAGQAWKQLGQLAYALAVPPAIQMAASTQDNAFGDWNRESQETVVNTLKGIVAWDQWAENPGAAAGTTVFNVGTIFIPAGAAVTSIKSGALASKLATAARVIDYLDATSLVVKGGVGTFKITSSGLGQLSNLIDGVKVADNAASQIPSVNGSTISIGDNAVSGVDEAIPPVREDVQVDVPVRNDPSPTGTSELPGTRADEPTVADDAPTVADDAPTVADDAPTAADDAPSTADDAPAASDNTQTAADDGSATNPADAPPSHTPGTDPVPPGQPSGADIFGPHYDAAVDLFQRDPDWIGDPDAAWIRQGDDLQAARDEYSSVARVGGEVPLGHHRQGLAFGGSAIDPANLQITGEARIAAKDLANVDMSFYTDGGRYGKSANPVWYNIYQREDGLYVFGKNPRHTEITTFQNRVLAWQRSAGLRIQ